MIIEDILKQLDGFLVPASQSDLRTLPTENLVKIYIKNQEQFVKCHSAKIPIYKETISKPGSKDLSDRLYILITFDSVVRAAKRIYED